MGCRCCRCCYHPSKEVSISLEPTTNPPSTSTSTINQHACKETNIHTIHYPEHPPRVDTPLYRKTHHTMWIVADLPCWICGRNHKSDGAITETHHFFCEKAAENAIDWKKFGNKAQFLYNPQTGLHLGSSFNWEEVQRSPDLFVDSCANMIVLCPEHHRSETKGFIMFLILNGSLQSCAKDGFVFLT